MAPFGLRSREHALIRFRLTAAVMQARPGHAQGSPHDDQDHAPDPGRGPGGPAPSEACPRWAVAGALLGGPRRLRG